MQRKNEAKTRGEAFVERVVWNAAAAAALAVMILLLLYSLQWLDRLAAGDSPGPATGVAGAATGVASAPPTQLARPLAKTEDRSGGVVAVNRPSG